MSNVVPSAADFKPAVPNLAETLCDAADFVTVLTAHDGCNLTKTIFRRADGALDVSDYDDPLMFRADAHGFNTLEELMWLLMGLEPNQCIVHGRVIPGTDTGNMRRLYKARPDGTVPTIEMAPHFWFATDVDKIEAKDAAGSFDPVAEPERAVACVIAKLPPEFKDAGCIRQFTSSAGIKPDIRMRLYFTLTRPLTSAEVKAWLKGAPVDLSIYTPNHIIYAANPIIAEGAIDPIGKARRPALLQGNAVTPPDVIVVVEHEPRKAAPGVEQDTPRAIMMARQYLAKIDIADGLFKPACRLLDLGISPDKAVELFEEVGADYEWAAEKVQHALDHRQNDFGCDVPTDWQAVADRLGIRHDSHPEPNESNGEPKEANGVRVRSAAGLRPQKYKWLWQGHLCAGALHILAGGKGDGKSTAMFDWAATITRGGAWPDGSQAPLGDVLIWSGEDDFAHTILPRFLVAGGDPSRLYFPDGTYVDGEKRHFDPATDLAGLRKAAEGIPRLQMILVDPIVMVATGDGNNNVETRRALQPVVDLAHDCGAALIGITHFNKNSAKLTPLERINGSIAWTAVSRMVFATVAREDGSLRRLVRVATNIAETGGGFDYRLHQEPVAGEDFTAQRVQWAGRVEGSPRTLLDLNDKPEIGRPPVELTAAAVWLEEYLRAAGDHGIELDEVYGAAKAFGHASRTIDRARSALPIETRRNAEATGRHGYRWVLLPPEL